jgi:hypothetical protein
MPSYAIPSERAADEKFKDNNISLHAHSASGSSIFHPSSAPPLSSDPRNSAGIVETNRNDMVRRLIHTLEQGVGYTGATCGDELEGLLRGMHMQADATGIAYPKGSSAYHAFTFGVAISHVSYVHPMACQ